MAERQQANWRGLPAWRVASERLWVDVCPERGGKVVSLFDVRGSREWLLPAPLRPLRPLTYGALYASYDVFGWDDAFPTLGECAYPGPGRLAGVRLPDHGEVWSQAWDDESTADDIVIAVRGVALPYRLRKRVSVEGPTLTLSYELVNEGDDPMPFQWAAYPVFPPGLAAAAAAGEGLRLSWDSAEVPWFRRSNGTGYVALCPTTADGPDLESAASSLSVAPGARATWSVHATVG